MLNYGNQVCDISLRPFGVSILQCFEEDVYMLNYGKPAKCLVFPKGVLVYPNCNVWRSFGHISIGLILLYEFRGSSLSNLR